MPLLQAGIKISVEFNHELAQRGISSIAPYEYTKVLTDAAKEDDWIAPTPRVT